MAGAPASQDDIAQPLTRVPHVSQGTLRLLRRVFGLLQAVSPALAARAGFHLFLRTFRRPLRAADRTALGRARAHQLMAGRDPMRVYEWGAGERRVIILHGWGSGAARFTDLAEALAARGWHVLVPDAPGHGASPGKTSSLPQFIAGLDAVVAHFGAPHALIGHSLGALGIACRHAAGPPDWAARLEAVVLISMPSGAPFLMEVFLQSLQIRSPTRKRLLHRFERRFGTGLDGFRALPGATRIAARVLMVHDADDDIVPHDHSNGLVEHVPAAGLLTTTELGHSALTRDAGIIGRVADFLDGDAVRS